MNSFGITDQLLQSIISLIKGNSIERAYIFGSRARGDFTAQSDLDLAVSGKYISSKKINLLKDALDNINTVIEFDLVNIERLEKKELLENIRREGVLIYDREAKT